MTETRIFETLNTLLQGHDCRVTFKSFDLRYGSGLKIVVKTERDLFIEKTTWLESDILKTLDKILLQIIEHPNQ